MEDVQSAFSVQCSVSINQRRPLPSTHVVLSLELNKGAAGILDFWFLLTAGQHAQNMTNIRASQVTRNDILSRQTHFLCP